MNVVYDLLGFQSRDHGERGIARYVLQLGLAIERMRPGLVTEYLSHPDLPFPAGAEELLATGRVVRSDHRSHRRDPSAGGVFIAGSPFETFNHPSELVLPPFARSPRWRSAAVVHDVIPGIFPELYLTNPLNVEYYRARLNALRGFDRFLTNSQATTDDAIEMLDLEPADLTIIGAGADRQFCRPPRGHEAAAAALVADGDLPGLRPGFILFPTGIDPRKNIERTIEAYGLLPEAVRARHQLVLSCRLSGPDREHLDAVAAAAGVTIAQSGDNTGASHGSRQGDMLVTGYVSDEVLRRLYQSAHLVLFPSYYEGFGLPALEAMHCGAPVICADATSLREVQPLAEARFDPMSAKAIAAAVEHALADDDFRDRLRNQTLPPFTWELAAERTASVIDELAEAVRIRIDEVPEETAKPRLAVFSPLPPQTSEAATYTFQLLHELSDVCDITVFVDENPLHVWAPNGVAIERADDYDFLSSGGGAFDQTLVMIGNDRYHGHCLEALERRPCAAIFHSARITEIYNDLQQRSPERLHGGTTGRHLGAMYPGRYRAEVEAMPLVNSETADRFGVLMSAEAARRATEVFVHSEYAASMVKIDSGIGAQVLGPLPCPPIVERIKPVADHQTVAVLGSVDRRHQPEKLIAAWAGAARDANAILCFAGHIDDGYRHELQALAADLHVADSVDLSEQLSDDAAAHLIDTASCAVQLSSTTDGSNSAVVARLLTNGVPTIVSAIGPNRELPDDVVVAVDVDVETDRLSVELGKLLADDGRREAIASAAVDYAKKNSPAAAALILADHLFTSATGANGALMHRLLDPIRHVQNQTLVELNRLQNAQSSYVGDNQVLTRLFTGQKIFVDSRDISVTPALILEGRWEAETTDVFLGLLEPSDTVIDIGANMGYFGLIAGTVLDGDEGGSVHLIEANPHLIPLLFKSLNVTGLVGMATVSNLAISDEAGELQLHVPEHLWGSSFLDEADDTFRESIESTTSEELALREVLDVPAMSLDQFTADRGIERVDVIKMDIEGHEERAYRGMARVIDENREHLHLLLEFTGHQYDDPTGFMEQIKADFKFVAAIQPGGTGLIDVASYSDVSALSEPGFVMLVASNTDLGGR
ncbi:MAG: FkbM family methyltransferase [Acidimicrobiales bacterium]